MTLTIGVYTLQKYEYACVYKVFSTIDTITKTLNEYAKHGWELVCTDKEKLYFKREINNSGKQKGE